MRVAVVGGGIAGLAAAHRIEALAPDLDVVLLEREPVVGGKIQTERVSGFVIEAAPDSFLSRKERGVGLCEELGLTRELVGRKAENHRSFVRRGHELLPLPEGLTGMIPSNLDALEESPLLTRDGKRRFAAEPQVPVERRDGDESVASFVSRRFGREAYEALVEPLMTGIYGGDGEQLSLEATFPQLRALELEHGSVLAALRTPPAESRFPPFVSLRGGMDALVGEVVGRLRRTTVLCARAATRVRAEHDGYAVEIDDGTAIRVEAVVLATPAFVTAGLVAGLDDELARAHSEIPYASSAIVTLAFAREDVTPLAGYGWVVPRAESADVLACTWTSQKLEGRAPSEAVLVRVYAGRFGGRDVTLDSDDELVALARAELSLAGFDAEPMLTRVRRWPLGMPQYVLGHPDRLGRIESALGAHPGLGLAGAAYRGVGIPDCIASGEAAAETVARVLGSTIRDAAPTEAT